MERGTPQHRDRRTRTMVQDAASGMSAFVVVNPRSGNGRTGREWKSIEHALGAVYPAMSVGFTRKRGEATALVRYALREGHQEIVAVRSEERRVGKECRS